MMSLDQGSLEGDHRIVGGAMNEDESLEAALVDELDIIEEQPLEARAPMYDRIHDRLRAELDN